LTLRKRMGAAIGARFFVARGLVLAEGFWKMDLGVEVLFLCPDSEHQGPLSMSLFGP
jgi:hypothetical protein